VVALMKAETELKQRKAAETREKEQNEKRLFAEKEAAEKTIKEAKTRARAMQEEVAKKEALQKL